MAEDEAGLYLQATTAAAWSPVGQTPCVRVDPGRAQTHFYGTLNLATGKEVVLRSDVMNAQVSARYVEQLLAAYPKHPIVLLWDRAPWHRGPAIRQVLASALSAGAVVYALAHELRPARKPNHCRRYGDIGLRHDAHPVPHARPAHPGGRCGDVN